MTEASGRPPKPPTVIHVTTVAMSLELLLGPQLEAFVAAGYRVIGASGADEYVPAVEARGVEHVALRHATRAWSPGDDLRLCRELYRLFRELRPDIVHTHNPKPGVIGRLAAGAARVPVVVNTLHGLYAMPDDPFAKRAVVYGLERLASVASDAELVQNPEDVPVLRRLRIPADKITLLGNGVDLDRFSPDPAVRREVRAELGFDEDEVVFGVVGRLVEEKGLVELFEVVERLREPHPDVRWMVVGPDDPDKPDALDRGLVKRAEEAGVVFLGRRSDVERLYRAMDVFVLPSHREGFSRSGMEAAASGLPIITTDVRGCRQVVRDGGTGLLVPVRDPDALEQAVVALAGDADRRSAMAGAARALAEAEFDQRRQVETTLDTYTLLLSRGPRPHS